ncbi:MAG: glycosyltransferase family 39 protein [Candidatus Gottesmanbacteria bacterium]|nr:glycosyltransferase family 39 protein [Candidatus Gottesmanbacteria bacterium]
MLKIKNKHLIILFLIFICHIFFRFYNLERWANFGWDQLDNAWAAVRIITVQKYPLIGMEAKQNSGIYIGPLYYYLVALFYFFTHLNPVASPILAACTSIVSFYVIYYVSKQLFNTRVALFSCFIYTFSTFIIQSERSQWPVNFIAPLSILIFYYLYKVIAGQSRYFIHLAACVGLSFQIHFTSIFYPIIIILTIPFFPKNRSTLKYIGFSLLIFLLYLAPHIIYYLQTHEPNAAGKYSTYIQTYYHGFHMKRVLQLVHDAFIEFYAILETPFRFIGNAVFLFILLFGVALLKTSPSKNSLKLLYLVLLWIVVPWIIFATYSGELSNYYFSVQLYLAIVIFGYISARILESKYIVMRAFIGIIWLYFAYANITSFFHTDNGDLINYRLVAKKAIESGIQIPFVEGDPKSYFYFYLMYTQKHIAPYRM